MFDAFDAFDEHYVFDTLDAFDEHDVFDAVDELNVLGASDVLYELDILDAAMYLVRSDVWCVLALIVMRLSLTLFHHTGMRKPRKTRLSFALSFFDLDF